MYRRAYTLLIGTAVAIYVATCVVAIGYDRPPVEPEGKLLGPSLTWVLEMAGAVPSNIWLLNVVLLIDVLLRALTVLIAAVAVDLVVGTVVTRRGDLFRRGETDAEAPSTFALFRVAAADRWRTRWTRERTRLVVIGHGLLLHDLRLLPEPEVRPAVRAPGSRPRSGQVKALSYDRELHVMDKVLFFGNDPSDVLHTSSGPRSARTSSARST